MAMKTTTTAKHSWALLGSRADPAALSLPEGQVRLEDLTPDTTRLVHHLDFAVTV